MSVSLEDGGNGDNNTGAENHHAASGGGGGGSSTVSRSGSKGSANGSGTMPGTGQNAILQRLFYVFEHDPKGAVHRAWGITLLFMVAFFVISVIEMVNIKSSGRSQALTLTAVLTGFMHLLVAILGTFVLRRFPTSFSVGFLLGILVVLANQNLLLEGIFRKHSHQVNSKSNLFANMGTCLFIILAFFSVLLYHFKNDIVVAPPHNATSSSGSGAATADKTNKLNAAAAATAVGASSSRRNSFNNKSSSLASLSPATSPSSSVDYQTASSHKKHHHRRDDADDDDDYNYHRHGDEEAT